VLFENSGDTLEQMVVATAEDPQDPRQQAERLDIRPDVPNRRAYHRSDEDDVPAALAASDAAEPAELPQGGPVMGIGRDTLRIRPTANGEEHDAARA
jgi:hypothetical protein